jgi:exopolysaccharide biosynthesis polyprenyl glycosylphosphotransferase
MSLPLESTPPAADGSSAEDLTTQLRQVPPPPDRAGEPSPPLRRILYVADLVVIVGGWVAAVLLGDLITGHDTAVVELAVTSGILGVAGIALAAASGLYRREVSAIRSIELTRIGRTVTGLFVVAVLVRFVAGSGALFTPVVLAGALWGALLTLERGMLREWITTRRAEGDFSAPVVVAAGDPAAARDTATFLAENPLLGFEVRGVVCPPPGRALGPNLRWVGDTLVGASAVQDVGATGVVVDNRHLTGEQLSIMVQDFMADDLHVHVASGLRGVERRRITVAPMADETFLHVAPLRLSHRQLAAKRVLDVVLGSLAFIVFLPVLAVASFLVWAYDRGPVFFRQERVGLDGQPFTLYKLRTMAVDAEARRQELEAQNARSGPLFKLAKDPRVTPVGRLLRSTSIDELPQLINVLQGSMSLVGPRPALPDEVASFDAELNRRLTVKPGVTGLWQVEARDSPNFDLYRRYDLLYVQNFSIGLDLAVIARTAGVVAFRGMQALLRIGGRSSSGGVLD